jgi:hypothetical protein
VEESIDRCDIHLVSELGRGRVENDTQYGGEATEEGKKATKLISECDHCSY